VIFKKLTMNNIRRFQSKVVDFDKGINVISGPNESGKSTIVECLVKLFFVKPGSKAAMQLIMWGKASANAELEYIGEDASEYKLAKEFGDGGKAVLWKDGHILTENENRIQNTVLAELGVDDERVFKNIFCLDQGEMLRISGEGNKTKEKLMSLVSGSQERFTSQHALEVIEDEMKNIGGRSRSPDISLQRGTIGCLEAERLKLREAFDVAVKLEETIKKLDESDKKNTRKNEEIKKYAEALEGAEKYSGFKDKKQEYSVQQVELRRKLNEIVRASDRLKEVENRAKKILFMLNSAFLLAGLVLFIAGAALIYSQKTLEGISGWITGAVLIIVFVLSPAHGLKREKEVLAAKLNGLTGGKTIEELEAKEQQYLQSVYNIERLMEELKKYDLQPVQLLGYRKLMEKAGTEYEVLLDEKKSIEADIRLFRSIVSADTIELMEELSWIDERIESFRRRFEACRLAAECMKEAINQTNEMLVPELKTEAEEVVSKITAGKYNRVDIDKKDFKITVFSLEKGDFIVPEELSMGVVDQVYFSLRLVLSRIIARNRRVPIILDDPFSYFDDLRKENAMQILRELSGNYQFLIFSSHDFFEVNGRNIRI